MFQRKFLVILIIFSLAITACDSIGVDQEATASAGTAAAQSVQQTVDAQATWSAADAQSTAEAATQEAGEALSTAEAATQSAASTASALETEQAALTQAAQETAEAAQATATRQAKDEADKATQAAQKTEQVLQKTAAAQPMADLVQGLKDQGILETTAGEYFKLDDFDESWAQLGWYMFFDTGYSTQDFVVKAHFAWDTASDKADPWFSGCGFVFRAESEENHYMAFLALDGYVRMNRFRNGVFGLIGERYYGKVGFPAGEADFVLAGVGKQFTVFVNGTKAMTATDPYFDSGWLHYTLVSGTNKGYGFECYMTEVELWKLER